jgi:predicted TIM-barrel fold metal-dependent hydrolase
MDEHVARIFDADNHYWETSDAFTRHRDPKFADRGVLVQDVDGQPRYLVGGQLHPIIPGPGDVTLRPRPGSLFDYFAGKSTKADLAEMLACETPSEHPEWFDRDARLRCMDEQGVEACWMFPSQGVCMEGPMQPDLEASVDIFRAFNRWLDDDWGFAYEDRIFAAPYISLSDLDWAISELEWAAGRGARVIVMRPAAPRTADGPVPVSVPRNDPFWARVQEIGLTVVAHAGDSGYSSNGYAADGFAAGFSGGGWRPNVKAFHIERAAHDFLITLVFDRLFERFPGVRVASVENGADFLRDLFKKLTSSAHKMPGYYAEDPAETFRRNIWINPFWEDDVHEVVEHMGADRVIFGSDWPHIEGMPRPLDYAAELKAFDDVTRRKILRDNARELNTLRPA